MSHSLRSKIFTTSVALLTIVLAQSFAVSVSADSNETAVGGANSSQQASISGGVDQTCVLLATGTAKCWGSNSAGQLGDNTLADKKTPIEVTALSNNVASISTGGDGGGYQMACAVLTTGAAKCWGSNESGQLGDGDVTLSNKKVPVDVSGLSSGVSSIAVGVWHACALTTSGAVKCWGWNGHGAVGDNSTDERHVPTAVVGLSSGVKAITAGTSHSCALLTSGGAKCWGLNENGQLGNNALVQQQTPVDVTGLASGLTAITAGTKHTCALLATGAVKCWGWNGAGQLGDNTLVDKKTPVDVTGLTSGVTAITAGLSHTCALLSTGGVKCWGSNNKGQLGDNTLVDKKTPVDVTGLASGVTAITTGFNHTCALLTNGGIKCWGSNSAGQLGDNTLVDKSTPVDVTGLTSGVGPTTTTTTIATPTTIAATSTAVLATTTVPATTTTTSTTAVSTTANTAPAPKEQVVLNLSTPTKPLLPSTSLTAGDSVSLTFSGFVPGEFVQLVVASTPQVIASGYADRNGSITLSGKVPASLSAGNHSLALYAPTSGHGVRQPVTVVTDAVSLPTTGTSTTSQLPMTAGLLIIGLLLVTLSRRHRSIITK